jgi:hypothetical protein
VLVFAVSGCSSNSVVEEPVVELEYPVAVGSVPFTTEKVEPEMLVNKSATVEVLKDYQIRFTAGGSGSCPPVVNKITAEGVNVKLFQSLSDEPVACTRDFRTYSYVYTVNIEDVNFYGKMFQFCNELCCYDIEIVE